jgi:hypothetical protein
VYVDSDEMDKTLKVAQKATELYRGLTRADSATWLPELSLSLSNLAHRHRAVHDLPRAVYAAQESVKHYRRISADDPVWTVDLARALRRLGDHQWADGRGDRHGR